MTHHNWNPTEFRNAFALALSRVNPDHRPRIEDYEEAVCQLGTRFACEALALPRWSFGFPTPRELKSATLTLSLAEKNSVSSAAEYYAKAKANPPPEPPKFETPPSQRSVTPQFNQLAMEFEHRRDGESKQEMGDRFFKRIKETFGGKKEQNHFAEIPLPE